MTAFVSNAGTVLFVAGSFMLVVTHLITLTICPQMTRRREKTLMSCGSVAWIIGAGLILAGMVGI